MEPQPEAIDTELQAEVVDGPEDYVSCDSLLKELRTQCVRLVKLEYIYDHFEEDRGPLPCRQQLPEEAFLDLDALSEEEQQKLLVIAVSYCWLSNDHPDPESYHLETLHDLIEAYWNGSDSYSEESARMGFLRGGRADPVGLFIDWASLYQDKPTARTEEQARLFESALKRINLWYAHQSTVVWRLTCLPKEAGRPPYAESGWPFFEQVISSFIKPGPRVLRLDEAARQKLRSRDRQDYAWVQSHFKDMERCVPLLPEVFNHRVRDQHVTNSEDIDLVLIPKYQKTFDDILVTAQQLVLFGLETSTLLPMLHVGAHACRSLKSFTLSGPTDVRLDELTSSLGPGICSGLRELTLRECIGLSGDLVSLNLLVQLQKLNLQSCKGIGGDLANLSTLLQLRMLSLRGCSRVSGDLAGLSKLAQLQTLDLLDVRGVSGKLEGLSSLLQLQLLDLGGCRGVSGELSSLTPLVQLQRLNLRECWRVSGDLEGLAPLTQLQTLNLVFCNFVFGNLGSLGQMSRLQTLDMDSCLGLSWGLAEPLPLAQLQSLDLRSCFSSDLANLAGLMQLRTLILFRSKGVGDLSHLASLAQLRLLDLGFCRGIFGDISGLSPLVQLQKLNLRFCTGISGELASLAPLTQMRTLDLSFCKGVSGDLWGLSPLAELRTLLLFGCERISGDMAALKTVMRLETMSLPSAGEQEGSPVEQPQRGPQAQGQCCTLQ